MNLNCEAVKITVYYSWTKIWNNIHFNGLSLVGVSMQSTKYIHVCIYTHTHIKYLHIHYTGQTEIFHLHY